MTFRDACLLVGLTFPLWSGCGPKMPPTQEAKPPDVNVSLPVQREVTDYIDYTGRTDAVYTVDIRPRVTGYLVKMPFKEGSEVKAGDLLFEIDPRPYQAQYDRAAGRVELARAQLKLAKADYQRALVVAKTPGAISQQDLDKYLAAQEEAEAQVDAAVANLEQYKLNLDFCQVTSPIDGMVSRYYLTLGNLANQDTTLLTTVVSLDPMYAYFDLDERTLLRIRDAVNSGKLESRNGREIPVLMGLQNEEGYPHTGMINFINNKVDPFTGTITMRGTFANPKPEKGVRLLSSGMFVRVRIPLGKPHPALLVTDRAVNTDQSLKFLYLLGPENKVRYQRVTLGALQPDGLRVIEQGLSKEDWVIVSGLQQIQTRMVVSPDRVPMPIPTEEAAAAMKAADEAEQTAKPEPNVKAKDTPAKPQPTPETPAPEKPAVEKPAPGQPAAEKPAASQPAAEKPAASQPAAEPASSKPPTPQPPTP